MLGCNWLIFPVSCLFPSRRPSIGEMGVSVVDPERYEVPFAGEGMVNDYIAAYLHLQATR